MAKLLSLEDIGKFGVRAEDDGLHPVNPEDETWNESYFFDWYDEEGTNAGHCRIGLLSGEDRLWFWLFLYDGTGWVAIEEPRLPLSAFDTETRSLDRNGLLFSLSTTEPLLRARLKVEGFGRVVSGPSNGRIVPIGLDVDATAAGAAHSLGQHEMRRHADESYSRAATSKRLRRRSRSVLAIRRRVSKRGVNATIRRGHASGRCLGIFWSAAAKIFGSRARWS